MDPATTQLSAPLLRLALDNLADAVTIHDARGKLIYVNEATVNLIGGTSVEELLEAPPGFWVDRWRMYDETGREITPDDMPGRRVEPPPGWEVAVLFRAAGSANEAGGDFYDVVRLEDGWIAFVGDVTGKGAAAATITARARYTMISIAQMTDDAGTALQRVNLALTELGGLPFCTMAAAQLREAGRVEVMSAGHPLPVLVGREGATPLGEPGPLLGFDPEASWDRHHVDVAVGETLVLYSDGVTDAVGEDREAFGEQRLLALLAEASADGPADLVERLDRALLDFQSAAQRDDIAVLVVRRSG